MEYFLLEQDNRYRNTPILKHLFRSIKKNDICRERSSRIERITTLYVQTNKNMEYIDVLDSQLFILSEQMMSLLQKYEPKIIYKIISLIDFDNEVNEIYYMPILEDIECISEKSEFNLDRSILRKIILKEENIKGKSIFKLKGVDKPYIIVRLDLAESIMRRNFRGVKLTRLEKE